jgi:hypothetical protein
VAIFWLVDKRTTDMPAPVVRAWQMQKLRFRKMAGSSRSGGNRVANPDPMVSVSIAKLNLTELRVVHRWALEKIEVFPTFSPWIAELTMSELNRRDDPATELGMHALPQWNGEQLADALTGSYILVRLPITPAIASWADEIHRLIVANCSAALEQFVGEVVT